MTTKHPNRRNKPPQQKASHLVKPKGAKQPAAQLEIDAVKVARLMQDMAAGRYQMNPEAIADKLIAQALIPVRVALTH